MSYRDYFNIDPEYFPQVDKRIIEEQPDLWKKFYPHPSFVKLLQALVDVLERKQKLSMWVDGAYGTGKSHAVFTLKKMLEASDDETEEYFRHYHLDQYLCKKLLTQKNDGKILVCHRYGSSDILNDTDLIIAIQEGIQKALRDAGIDNKATASLKDSLIRFFENDENKKSFNVYAHGSYSTTLGGDDAESILIKLRQYDEESLRLLINKIFKVPVVSRGFSMNTEELCDWIREILLKNNLKEILFIWDEFSEYFENNMHHLTGFQQIAELAATAPFCLLIVTHKAEGYFSDGDPDKRKILDRFVQPIHISLPENISFELMAQAMKITEDSDKAAKWEKNKKSLQNRTPQSREAVKKAISLSDNDLSNVLPIHPYAALILQHISVYYTSTARSMFNFIKNDEGNDVKAFQWFIDNYDFSSQNPFVTVDMLWNFFYETGSQKLANGIREVLSSYTPKLDKELLDQEKQVLKVILLLQAISERMSSNQEIFLPNNKNLTLAFEGTPWEYSASKIANKLLNDHIVTRTPLTGEKFSYCCKNTGPALDVAQFMPDAKAKTTKDMLNMTGVNLKNSIELSGALKLRYSVSYATVQDFENEVKKANNPSVVNNKIYAVQTFAKDVTECTSIRKRITAFFESNPKSDIVIIDSSGCTLADDEYSQFLQNYATSLAIGSSDLDQRKTYEEYATNILNDWAKRIKTTDFYVYSKYDVDGARVANLSDLLIKMLEIDKYHYPSCLEGAYTNVANVMYDATALTNGALCGINQETKQVYRSNNEATKLENALKGAWKVSNYWKTTHSYISDLKVSVDTYINSQFEHGDRVSIRSIYDFLKDEPYGFMPCNFTSFIMGFILKEYSNSSYSYSDDITTVPLDSEKLSSMISDIIKQDNTLDKHYKEKYIVTLTDEEKAFNAATSVAFGIDEKYCVSITETRSRIREKMKGFSFPIWVIKYVLDDKEFKSGKENVSQLIDYYCGIANNKNFGEDKSDNDIALAIGKLCINSPESVNDLKSVLTKECCKSGMLEYLNVYKNGILPSLSKTIEDNGQFINQLQYKFNTDAANWVWNSDTVNGKIDELICEYEIVKASNSILIKSNSYSDTIQGWNNKISQIRLAYSIIKNELNDAQPFYEMLRDLYKQKSLLESQKKTFNELLQQNIQHFKDFMSSQSAMFKKACSYYLDDLSDEDIQTILEDDAYGFDDSYLLDPNKYIDKVVKAVQAYKNTQKSTKLAKKWFDLTGTNSPMEWSKKNKMPIMAMVPSAETAIARQAFDVINSKSKDELRVADALDYLDKITYINDLNSENAKNHAFQERLLKEYSSLLVDINQVKQYLFDHISESPYYWLGSKEVDQRIMDVANAEYLKTGYAAVKKVIDDMPEENVKAFLRKLTEDNIIVGIEILKNK